MSPARRAASIGLRFLAGGLLVALAARYGAVSRSPWTILYAAAALSIAMAATRKRYWSPPFEASRFWLTQRIVGTVMTETVLAAVLFFLAYGIAAAIGAAEPFAPLAPQDAYFAVGALALSMAIFGIIFLVEGGRDPIDIALEELDDTLDAQHGDDDDGSDGTKGDAPPRRQSDIERVAPLDRDRGER